MTTPPMQQQIERLHALYCELYGSQIRMLYHHQMWWHQWITAGFSESDLRLVIAWIKEGIAKERWTPSRLRFSYLIERPERFGEELAEAQAVARNKKAPPSPRERVLAQARPTVVESDPDGFLATARPIGDYIEQMRRAAQ